MKRLAKMIISCIKNKKYYKLDDKINTLRQLLDNEINIEDIKYLNLSGYCSENSKNNKPNEEYIIIDKLVDYFKNKRYFEEEYIGIYVSGIVYYHELIISKGKMTYRKEIRI